MDLDLEVEAADNSIEGNMGGEIPTPECSNKEKVSTDIDVAAEVDRSLHEAGLVLEPYIGMEFDSEEAAKNFYNEYARQVGFVVRLQERRRSNDGRTVARKVVCNKEGFSRTKNLVSRPDKKPRPGAREGCNASMLVRMEKSGKWVVKQFVKEHTHPLDSTGPKCDKDKKIEALNLALRHEKQLCAAYRENLLNLMSIVEAQSEQLSSKVLQVVENVKNVEAEGKLRKT